MSEDRLLFDEEMLNRALQRLSEVLQERNILGNIFMVGGAAMILGYKARESTGDVDSVFVPKREVMNAALQVAIDLDLPNDWLNDAAKGFMPGSDPDAIAVFRSPFLSVDVASPRYLLAMKLMSFRQDRDVGDIKFLLKECGLQTVDQGLDLMLEYFPGRPMELRSQLKLQEMMDQSAKHQDKRPICGYRSDRMRGACMRPAGHKPPHKSK